MQETKTSLILTVGGEDLDAETVQRHAMALRQMLEQVLEEGEVITVRSSEVTPGSKGDPITLGTIMLALITSGSLVRLVQCVKAIIVRDPAVHITIATGRGQHVDLDTKNVNDQAVIEILDRLVKMV